MDPWSERELWVWGWAHRQNDRENVRKASTCCYVTSPSTLMPCWTCVESIKINCVPKVRSPGLGLWSSEDKWNQSRMEVGQRRHDHQEDKRRIGTTLLSASSKQPDRQDGGWLCNSSNRSGSELMPINISEREEYWHCPFDENQFQKSLLCGRIAQDIGTVWTAGTSLPGSHTPSEINLLQVMARSHYWKT